MPFYSITTGGGLVEAATFAALPATGATETLYVVTATNTLYRWSGSAYVEVSASPAEVVEAANLAAFPATGAAGKIYVALDTGKTYRWSGSAYAEISASDWATITGKPTTFAPSAHASSHGSGGSDAVTPASIGAANASHGHNASDVFVDDLGTSLFPTDEQLPEVFVSIDNAIAGRAAEVHTHSAGDITSGTIATARLASGTASASTYLRGDQTWAAVASYTLPNATTTTLGGVIVGAGLSVSSGTVSANVASVAGRTGAVTIAHSDVGNAPATLTQFSAAQNNLALGTGGIVRISSSAAVNVTGFVATSAGDARLLSNVGTFAITLKHSDAASTAANRILCVGSADVVIAAGGSAVVYYDATDSRWRVG